MFFPFLRVPSLFPVFLVDAAAWVWTLQVVEVGVGSCSAPSAYVFVFAFSAALEKVSMPNTLHGKDLLICHTRGKTFSFSMLGITLPGVLGAEGIGNVDWVNFAKNLQT